MSRRWCARGIHHGTGAYAWRLILAKVCLDKHAEQIVADEIGDCAGCWRDIADTLAGAVWTAIVHDHGVPDMTPTGLVEGRAVDYTTVLLYDAIDAAARDARHLDEAA
jgi:hypothetical protein